MSHQPLASEIPVYTLKVYAYDYLISYSAPYLINGREFRISFREGAEWPVYRPAEFRTTDPLIQQAIEAHPTFGPNVRILQVLTHVPHLINPLPPDFPRHPQPTAPQPTAPQPTQSNLNPAPSPTDSPSAPISPYTLAGAAILPLGHLSFSRPNYTPAHLLSYARMPALIRHAARHASRAPLPIGQAPTRPPPE